MYNMYHYNVVTIAVCCKFNSCSFCMHVCTLLLCMYIHVLYIHTNNALQTTERRRTKTVPVHVHTQVYVYTCTCKVYIQNVMYMEGAEHDLQSMICAIRGLPCAKRGSTVQYHIAS